MNYVDIINFSVIIYFFEKVECLRVVLINKCIKIKKLFEEKKHLITNGNSIIYSYSFMLLTLSTFI